jgi:hypothetical protein
MRFDQRFLKEVLMNCCVTKQYDVGKFSLKRLLLRFSSDSACFARACDMNQRQIVAQKNQASRRRPDLLLVCFR